MIDKTDVDCYYVRNFLVNMTTCWFVIINTGEIITTNFTTLNTKDIIDSDYCDPLNIISFFNKELEEKDLAKYRKNNKMSDINIIQVNVHCYYVSFDDKSYRYCLVDPVSGEILLEKQSVYYTTSFSNALIGSELKNSGFKVVKYINSEFNNKHTCFDIYHTVDFKNLMVDFWVIDCHSEKLLTNGRWPFPAGFNFDFYKSINDFQRCIIESHITDIEKDIGKTVSINAWIHREFSLNKDDECAKLRKDLVDANNQIWFLISITQKRVAAISDKDKEITDIKYINEKLVRTKEELINKNCELRNLANIFSNEKHNAIKERDDVVSKLGVAQVCLKKSDMALADEAYNNIVLQRDIDKLKSENNKLKERNHVLEIDIQSLYAMASNNGIDKLNHHNMCLQEDVNKFNKEIVELKRLMNDIAVDNKNLNDVRVHNEQMRKQISDYCKIINKLELELCDKNVRGHNILREQLDQANLRIDSLNIELVSRTILGRSAADIIALLDKNSDLVHKNQILNEALRKLQLAFFDRDSIERRDLKYRCVSEYHDLIVSTKAFSFLNNELSRLQDDNKNLTKKIKDIGVLLQTLGINIESGDDLVVTIENVKKDNK